MTPTPYTEDTLVQQTTAEYLEQQLGGESIYAYDNEGFGPDSLLGRASDREVALAVERGAPEPTRVKQGVRGERPGGSVMHAC